MHVVSGRTQVHAPNGVRVAATPYPRGIARRTKSRQGGVITMPLGELGAGVGRLESVVSASLPLLFSRVKVISNYSPPTTFDVASLVQPGTPSPAVRAVQPTIVLSGGSLGTQIMAPAGQADPNAWKWNVGKLLAGYVAVWATSSYISYRLGKRAGRRGR